MSEIVCSVGPEFIRRGDTFECEWQVFASDDGLFDLSPWTIVLYSSAEEPRSSAVPNSGLTKNDTNSVIRLVLSYQETADLVAGTYDYRLIRHNGTIVRTLDEHSLVIKDALNPGAPL